MQINHPTVALARPSNATVYLAAPARYRRWVYTVAKGRSRRPPARGTSQPGRPQRRGHRARDGADVYWQLHQRAEGLLHVGARRPRGPPGAPAHLEQQQGGAHACRGSVGVNRLPPHTSLAQVAWRAEQLARSRHPRGGDPKRPARAPRAPRWCWSRPPAATSCAAPCCPPATAAGGTCQRKCPCSAAPAPPSPSAPC